MKTRTMSSMRIMLSIIMTVFVTPLFAASAESGEEVFIVQNGKQMEMDYVAALAADLGVKAGSGMALGAGGGILGGMRQFAIMAQDEHAQMKIKNKTPVFYVRSHPSKFILAKFDKDTFKGKMVRYVIKNGFLGLGQDDGSQGVPDEYKVEFDYKKEENGKYRITSKQPLEKGEYAIIIETTNPGGESYSYKIFDFAVE